jgi:hypothetical protein
VTATFYGLLQNQMENLIRGKMIALTESTLGAKHNTAEQMLAM